MWHSYNKPYNYRHLHSHLKFKPENVRKRCMRHLLYCFGIYIIGTSLVGADVCRRWKHLNAVSDHLTHFAPCQHTCTVMCTRSLFRTSYHSALVSTTCAWYIPEKRALKTANLYFSPESCHAYKVVIVVYQQHFFYRATYEFLLYEKWRRFF